MTELPSVSECPILTGFDGVLYLRQSGAKFSTPSKKESIFFDECNREIISLTSCVDQANTTRVVFQRVDNDEQLEFLLPTEKRVLTIKLNPDRSILAYHVERNIVEFINVLAKPILDGKSKFFLDGRRYIQASRAKNSKLMGFLWTGPTELVIVTDLSVEFYHVDASRRRLNLFKIFQSVTNWFVYQPSIMRSSIFRESHCDNYSILMVSTGSLGNLMQPYMFAGGQITRLQRFEVEGYWHGNEKLELFEKSITIANIYGYVRLLVLQHESLNTRSRGAQIVVYTIDPDSGGTTKTHTLDLDLNGRFAINILDNLVIAHDQPSKTSFIFDIMIQSTEKSDCPNHFVSLIDSLPLRNLVLEDGRSVEMYSLNWVFFQPNFIVDAKLGLLTTLQIDLSKLQDVLQDNNLLLNFLAHRTNAQATILAKCRQIVQDAFKQSVFTESESIQIGPLADVSSTFEILSQLSISAPELANTVRYDQNDSTVAELTVKQKVERNQSVIKPIIYQEDIQRELFRDLDLVQSEQSTRYHFIVSTLLEFIFAVRRIGKNVEFCIYEQLVRCMINSRHFFQITQMIRSEVLKDSKQLACLLLSLKDHYKPAGQLGLDMFHRLPGGLPTNLPSELIRDC